MLSLKQYYYLAIWLPLVFPLLFISKLEGSTFIHCYYILGGIPYLFFMVFIFFKFHSKTIEFIEKEAWLLPLKFIPFCAALIFLGSFIIGITHPDHFGMMMIMAAGFAGLQGIIVLIAGYFYVTITFALAELLRDLRVIKK